MRSALCLLALLPVAADSSLPPGLTFERGPVNRVTVGRDIAVYSASGQRRLLITHARRDSAVVPAAASGVVVPAAEADLFREPLRFWTELETARFHDYAQKSTKVPVAPVPNVTGAREGDRWTSGGATIRVVDTPGYTPGAVSYVIEAGGKRIVCTGDLIYGNGQILDLYSLQDAVPEAKARGYHGYAARAGQLIASLRKIAALKPDILLPSRGPEIRDPQRSIALLISRLQRFLKSHFETDALRWYWGDENHAIRSRAVEAKLDVLPMAEQSALPPDILALGNSRLIISRSGAAFLVDAGYRRILEELRRLKTEGKIRSVDGIWITHYHDDHTDFINDVVKEFGSRVYFSGAMSEVMANPGAFRLPCLTTRPVSAENAKRDGENLRWNEWRFTFWHFPGQTLYHGGLVAARDDGSTFLFAGDSFTPSGMDDYCMQNRVFLRKGEGYQSCLRRIEGLPRGAWILNQHVQPMFRYSTGQVGRMQAELGKRSAVLRELSPWPDVNFMVDESWARLYPYGQEAAAGAEVRVALRVMNHAPRAVTYRAKWNLPRQWKLVKAAETATIPAGKEGRLEAAFRAADPGLHVITADLQFDGWELPAWTEALVRIR